jgi:hypothetical protein
VLRHLRAVAANGFDRATFHRLFAERFFLRRFRLLVYVGMPTIIVTTEVRGRGFTTKIAVDALVIDVELSLYVLGVFICGVGHFFKAGKNVVEGRMNRNSRNGFLPRATAPNLEREESIT